MSLYIGIDVGKNGAIAVVADGRLIELHDMPLIGNEIDPHGLHTLLRTILMDESGVAMIAIEKASAMPKQGVTSMFSFGETYGTIKGIVATLGVPYEIVGSRTWKKVMLRDTNKDKDAARKVVARLEPNFADMFKRKSDHNRADAVLIAMWAEKNSKGEE